MGKLTAVWRRRVGLLPVMAGLVPAIHVFGNKMEEDVGAREKPGQARA
jgi:hypothetical protein